jgi:hypothetical protein
VNGKGDKRRPRLVDRAEFDKRWGETFKPGMLCASASGPAQDRLECDRSGRAKKALREA